MLDSVVAAETPEGILLEMRPAGLSARFCAFMIDWLICLAIAYGAAFVAGILGGLGFGFWLILIFALTGSTRWCSSCGAPAPRPASAPWA